MEKDLRLLELFAGSESYGKVARKKGWKVVSCDKYIETDITLGVEDITKKMILDELGGPPDCIVGSPTCSVWSKTGWFNHWDSTAYRNAGVFLPKTPYATESIEMVRKTIEIFSWFPDATFFMENPEGMLYLHPVIGKFVDYGLAKYLRREKITYCQYGFSYMKPTHIWTNSKIWVPRPFCRNGDGCHTSVPRGGALSGVMNMKDSFVRSVIPRELCEEILSSVYQVGHHGTPELTGDQIIRK